MTMVTLCSVSVTTNLPIIAYGLVLVLVRLVGTIETFKGEWTDRRHLRDVFAGLRPLEVGRTITLPGGLRNARSAPKPDLPQMWLLIHLRHQVAECRRMKRAPIIRRSGSTEEPLSSAIRQHLLEY
jgi:hypothetical protein